MKINTIIGLSMGLIDRGTLGVLGMRRIAPFLLLLLLMFAGAASATDYYVATWGDNTTQGNITHPWQNVSYATQQAVAGDTIHLFDGTWYSEVCTFANSGNATHPITLKAYNGTPTLDGQDTTFTDQTNVALKLGYNNYINVDEITIHNYYITISYLGSYCKVSNCVLHDTGWSLPPGQYGSVIIDLSSHDYTNNTIENCTLYNAGWNTVQVCGYHPPNGYAANITIRNCTIYNSTKHGAIDLFGNLKNVLIEENTIENCTQPGIGFHSTVDTMENIIIRNNTLNGNGGPSAMIQNEYSFITNLLVEYNNFTNMGTGCYPAYIYEEASGKVNNVTFRGNTYYNTTWGSVFPSGDVLLLDSEWMNTDVTYGNVINGFTNCTIRNMAGKRVFRNGNGANTILEFTDNRIFTMSYAGCSFDAIEGIRYYPANSSRKFTSSSGDYCDTSVTTYNITLIPTNSYLKDVAVNHEADAADDRTNISVNSSVSSNPTWINATMQNTSNTYNVSVDGGYVTQVVSDADKIVRYQYTSSWSPHDFEFEWHSPAGFSGAPDPTNLQSTKSSTWVRHSWSAGSGNVTDSYNVSVNSVWYNTTTNAYYNDTGLSAEYWSNITVWAFNNTGGISQNSISQNIQTDAAAWTPSNTAMYYNVSSTTTITTKTDGTNLFSRTPTEADGNATSGRMVVRTS